MDKEALQREHAAKEAAALRLQEEMKEAEEAEELARQEALEAQAAVEALERAKLNLQAALRVGSQGPIESAKHQVDELQAIADKERREAEEAAEKVTLDGLVCG